MGDAVVEVRGLTVSTTGGIEIVSDVALRLGGGEILGLAGESGSGKSTLIRAMLGYARPGTTIASGAVLLSDGAGSVTDLLRATPGELRRLRGRRVAWVG
jgi:ABC-type glutathione transport system ATPase component